MGLPALNDSKPDSRYRLASGILLGTAIVWSYWTTLGDMADRWSEDTQYSHGYLVPLFSLYLLYSRRSMLGGGEGRGRARGLGLLVLAGLMRLAGSYFYFVWADATSFILCLLGAFMLVGGTKYLRWAWPAILFLGFMVPLPYRVQTALSLQLQNLAAKSSVYLLQTCGVPSIAEGNLVSLSEVQLNVVEACNGLGMLMTFFAISTAMAILLSDQPLGIRIFIVLSAIPVAVISNVLRIAVTGFLYQHSQGDLARVVFHDLAGWLMMPLAVGLIFLQLSILNRLFVPVGPPRRPTLTFVTE